MQKYIFDIVCSERKVVGELGEDSRYKKVKLVETGGGGKTIELCGPYIGAYSIFQNYARKEFFEFFVEKAKYDFREGDFCDRWADGELYRKNNIPLEEVKLKVIFDDDCEYKIALSAENDEWITLPKPSLIGENLNLKEYYNQELKLSKGAQFLQGTNIGGYYYIPQVMSGQKKICELAPFSFPNCGKGGIEFEGSLFGYYGDHYRIVVEETRGKLIIHLIDENGNYGYIINSSDLPFSLLGDITNYVNSSLKAVLLENSNIREVLPELKIDDDTVNLNKRQLKCLINKMQNVDLARVAQELITNKANELGQSILEAQDDQNKKILVNSPILQEGVAEKLRENPGKTQGPKGEKGNPGKDGVSPLPENVATQLLTDGNKDTLVTNVASNEGLQSAVTTTLKNDVGFQASVKGDKGDPGPVGPKGDTGPKGVDGQSGTKGDPGSAGKDGESPAPNVVAQELITNKAKELGQLILDVQDDQNKKILVNSSILQEGVAEKLRENPGKTQGPKGEKGNPGKDGVSPLPENVATQLLTDGNKDTLVTNVASNEGLQSAVTTTLKNDVGFQASVKGDKGDPGQDGKNPLLDNLIKANDVKQKFTLQKGEKLSDDIYEANIALNGKSIATLPKIGYYMLNDQLVMHNRATQEKVIIPRDFHYLKVVKSNNDNYKLTFCNFLGNEFFEYKKYDSQYSNVSDEYKFISLSCMKKEYNLNLGELLSHRPSFFITEGAAEPDSLDKHQAVVFEVTNSGKGKKMATLTDEFGYFDKDGKFQYCDYHTEEKYRVYDHSSIEKKCTITDANGEFYFTGYDNLILHTTPQELF